MRDSFRQILNASSRKIARVYALAGALWLLLSAVALFFLIYHSTAFLLFALLSSGLYVGLSSLLLSRLLARHERERQHTLDELTSALTKAREMQTHTEAVIAAIGDAISIQDRDYRVMYQNTLHKELLGEHAGEYCHQAYRHLDHVCEGCHVALSFRDGGIHRIEQKQTVNGAVRCFEIISSPLRDSHGEVIACIEAIRDTTEWKRSEEAIRESEKRYRTLFENAGDAIFILDAEPPHLGRIVDANRAAAAMHGYTLQELLTMNITDLDSQEAASMVPERIQTALSGEWIHAEINHVRKDGSVFPVELSAGLLEIENRRFLLAIDRDISERKTAEEFRRNILEAVDEAFIVIDREFKVVSANAAYSRQAKMPLSGIIGKHCFEISHRQQSPCWEAGEDCSVRRTFETALPQTALHVHHDHEGNEIHVETKAFPMMSPSGEVVSAIEVINDVSAKRRLEEQLRHAQKMEAIGTLTGGIAHDFNNILTTILGYSSFLLKRLQQDDAFRQAIESIFTAAQRASGLTRSLLAFSRRQPMKTLPEDLNAVVRHLEKLLLRIIGEDIELITDLAAEDLTVMADRGQIEQVLMNLCTNARDAMADGGVITLGTGRVTLSGEDARARGLEKAGSYAVLSVTDTGTGIDEKLAGKIFDPFFTTKDVGKGTGLGLSIVYGIVSQHGGSIDVKSQPGRGAVFTIYLPLVNRPSRQVKPSAQAHIPGGTETILVAEDDDTVRKLVRNSLEEVGYSVVEAVNGEEAVRRFSEDRRGIHLLILDVVMPKKNGKEVLDDIRKMRPDIKAIFMSGYTTDIIGKKGLATEDVEFLPKPLSADDLLKKVREVLQ